MNVNCPECRATLEPDEIDRDRRECPICGASLANLDLSEIEDQLGGEETIAGHPLTQRDDAGTSTTPAAADSVLEIIEESANRLVVHLPPNPSGTGGLGFFAFVWNAFMTVFTSIMYFAMQDKGGFELFPLVLVSLFWVVGVGMVVSWVRMRFTRVFLLLEKDRLVVQRKLMGTSNRELMLGSDRKALLEESYRINDVPVYQVILQGDGRKESFGVGLPEADKVTLAQKLNEFLGVESETLLPTGTESVCSICGAIVEQGSEGSVTVVCKSCQARTEQTGAAAIWPALRAGSDELPEDVVVDDADPDQIVIHYPLLPPTGFVQGLRRVVFGFVGLGVVAIIGMLIYAFRVGGNLPSVVFAITFSIPLLSMAVFGLAVTRSRTWIQLTQENVLMRWGWGPLSIRKQFPISSITECGLMRGEFHRGNGSPTVRRPTPFAGIKAGGTPYPLSIMRDTVYGQKVVRLVRTYLEDLTGQPLP